MAELKPCPFKKGDIVKNNYAGESNPFKYLMFLKCGTITHGRYRHKAYDCISYSGEKVQFFRDGNQLEIVGHMAEFDAFLVALKKLKGWAEDGN